MPPRPNMQEKRSNDNETDKQSAETKPKSHTNTVDIEIKARWPLPEKQAPEKQRRKSTWRNWVIIILLIALLLTPFLGQINELLGLLSPMLDSILSIVPSSLWAAKP